tara:strand:+ start:1787 stop:2281 length:495 start_codon:yes stop_codon:yes gene_type:complete
MDLEDDLFLESDAIEFINSFRGQYILGQALRYAIDAMEKVQPVWSRETSNIADMKWMLENGTVAMGLGGAMKKHPLYDSHFSVRVDGEEVASFEDEKGNGNIAIELAKFLDDKPKQITWTTVDPKSNKKKVEVVYEMCPTERLSDTPNDDAHYRSLTIYPMDDS